MAEVWVINASPTIVLAKAGHLTLIDQLCERCLLPEAVAMELLAGPADDPALQALGANWGERVRPRVVSSSVIEWGLGAGETSVLAVTLENFGSTAVLDDAAARSAARTLGVRVIGTLGIIIRAKLRGLIPSAAEVMRDLQRAGLFLDEKTIGQARERVGEDWKPR